MSTRRRGYREGRWGAREVEIPAVRLLDDRGKERHVYVPGESLTVALDVEAKSPVEDVVFGIGIFTADGVSVYGTNTHLEDYAARQARGKGQVQFVIDELRLVEGTYLVDVAAHRKDGTPYDYHRGLYTFRVKSRTKDVGVWRPRHRWTFSGGVLLDPPPERPELDLHDRLEDGDPGPRQYQLNPTFTDRLRAVSFRSSVQHAPRTSTSMVNLPVRTTSTPTAPKALANR